MLTIRDESSSANLKSSSLFDKEEGAKKNGCYQIILEFGEVFMLLNSNGFPQIPFQNFNWISTDGYFLITFCCTYFTDFVVYVVVQTDNVL